MLMPGTPEFAIALRCQSLSCFTIPSTLLNFLSFRRYREAVRRVLRTLETHSFVRSASTERPFSAMQFLPHCLRHPLVAAWMATLVVSLTALAQNPPVTEAPAGNEERRTRREFNPEEMRNRMSAALREQFQVEDDAEWAIISERIQKIAELRRAGGGGLAGAMAMRGMGPQPGRGESSAAGARPRMGGGSPETEALVAAVRSKAPDAELKARLERLREVRKANEAKLTEAQEELRAVLNLRQEAIAVVAGLLP